MIRIDGSFGEGGGQIVRTALALSAVLRRPVEIYNIRKSRTKPGLQPQHRTGVAAAAQIASAQVTGNDLGSSRLVFEPGTIHGSNFTFNVAETRGSAGSVTLIAQTVLPILFYADTQSEVTIQGGTHVPFSPCFDYLALVLVPTIANLGFNAAAEINAYGFYPAGGGAIKIRIAPATLVAPATKASRDSFMTTGRGRIQSLALVSAVSKLPLSIGQRQAERFLKRLNQNCTSVVTEVDGRFPGSYLFLRCETENGIAGFSSLGARGKPAESVADEAFDQFAHYLTKPGRLDPHLADQLVIFFALRKIPAVLSVTNITNHLLTTVGVIGQFIKDYRITLDGAVGTPGTLTLLPAD